MKFLLIEFLLIWELFSKIQIGMGLKCFLSINTECTQLLTHQLSDSKNSLPETELEVIKRNLTVCILDRSQKDKTRSCTEENPKCSQLTIKLNDGDKTWVRFCNGSNGSSCEDFRQSLLTYHKSRVDHAGCAYCDTDNCNVDLEDNSSPEDNSKPDDNSTSQDDSKPEGNSKQDDSKPEDMSPSCYISTSNICAGEILAFETYSNESDNTIDFNLKFLVDAARDKLVSCMKELREEQLLGCLAGYTECVTLTVKLKDDTKTSIKFCGKTNDTFCEKTKKIFDRFGNDLDYAKCTHCSANGCNLNPVPRLSGDNSKDNVSPEPLKDSRANEVQHVAALVLMIPLLVSLFGFSSYFLQF